MNVETVAVFGGRGFIGRKLHPELLKTNAAVWTWDINYSPMEDIRDFDFVLEITKHMDAVVNMCVLSHQIGNARPIDDFEVTARGTLNILEAARKNDVKKVLFASSVMVYGEPRSLPLCESMKCYPKVPYAVSKLAAEEYCRIYSELYGLKVIVLRYTNVYGPDQTGQFLFPELMGRISRGEPVTIYGDGSQTRDFIHVSDVTSANIAALQSDIDFGLFNVGLGKTCTVFKLVKMIYEAAGVEENINFEPERTFEIKNISVNTALVRAALGWAPKIELRDGLEETWEWFKNQ